MSEIVISAFTVQDFDEWFARVPNPHRLGTDFGCESFPGRAAADEKNRTARGGEEVLL